MDGTILWQRAEGAAILLAALALLLYLGAPLPWWAAALLFLAPDLSFAAYLAGPRVGAFVYNAVHVHAFGLCVLVAGLVLAQPLAAALGALWLGHSGFDRMLGYGLKSTEGFAVTHLGRIGKAR